MGGEGGGQFLSQKGEIELRRERIEWRRVGGLIPGGQNHIRKGKVFHSQGLFAGVRMKRLLEWWTKQR